MVALPFSPFGNPTGSQILSPSFQVRVGKDKLSRDFAPFISKLEYDSADGMADAAKIEVQNPDFVLGDLRIWQPGNEIAIAFGYENKVEHVGRVMIRRIRYNYPQDVMPSFSVEGYTRDVLMMDDSPEKGSDRVFANEKLSDIVRKVAGRGKYGFQLDIDNTEDTAGAHAQIGGVSDYQMVKGCANLSGFFFWVDGREDGKWDLHFKSPANVLQPNLFGTSPPSLTFTYNDGQKSNLFSFQPELLIHHQSYWYLTLRNFY